MNELARTNSSMAVAGRALAPAPPRVPHALRALRAIVVRELVKFSMQYGRLISALVRPLLWLAVFAAGFRNVFGVSIVPPYDTYIAYDVYIAPGLIGMVLLFNGMQSSLAMVYDREMGLMRLLLTAPLPRPWLLFCKLAATAVLSLAQALAFVAVAWLVGTELPLIGATTLHTLAAMTAAALMLGALGLPTRQFLERRFADGRLIRLELQDKIEAWAVAPDGSVWLLLETFPATLQRVAVRADQLVAVETHRLPDCSGKRLWCDQAGRVWLQDGTRTLTAFAALPSAP